MAASLGAALLLAACQSIPQAPEEPRAPAPVETENVKAVKALVHPLDTSVTVADAFAQYGRCHPGTQVWEEIEAGDVQFSCTWDDGTIMQFDFRFNEAREPHLAMVTFTTLNDAEFAGVSLRGPDAEDMLGRVYRNEPLF